MKRSLGGILGVRQLHRRVGSRDKATTVTLGKPRRGKDADWECPFHITGYGIHRGYGVDAIQALTTALEGIRVILEQSEQQFTWLGGDYIGFDRHVTSSLGRKFNTRLNRIIDLEIRHFVNSLKHAHQTKK